MNNKDHRTLHRVWKRHKEVLIRWKTPSWTEWNSTSMVLQKEIQELQSRISFSVKGKILALPKGHQIAKTYGIWRLLVHIDLQVVHSKVGQPAKKNQLIAVSWKPPKLYRWTLIERLKSFTILDRLIEHWIFWLMLE